MSTDPEHRLPDLDPLRSAEVAGWSASAAGRAARDRVLASSRTAASASDDAVPHRRRLLRSPAGAFAGTVAATAAAAVALSVAGTTPGLPGTSSAQAASALQSFPGCADLAAYYAETAADEVTAYGLVDTAQQLTPVAADGAVRSMRGSAESAPAPAPAAGDAQGTFDSFSAAGEAASGAAPEASTGTNVQERGVDEPDVAKTDGERLVLLRGGELVVLDVTGDVPRETGRLQLPQLAGGPAGGPSRPGVPGPAGLGMPADVDAAELMLDGDRVLVLTTSAAGSPAPVAEPSPSTSLVPAPGLRERTTLTLVDLAGGPHVERSLDLDGRLVDARLTGGALRVAVSSAPVGLPLQQPARGGVQAEAEALEANREAVRTADAQAWLPGLVLRDGDGTTLESGPLLPCDAVSRPPEPAGVRTLSLLTTDLRGADPLGRVDARGVVADGATLYASTDALVVATSPAVLPWWQGDGDDARTSLHVFDTREPGATEYVASGEVPGTVPGRWGLSEHDGLLRVVSTSRARDGSTATALHVLETSGDELRERGRVDGLGVGEDVYAVRFLGDQAYVVTFRQIDPLYVVDLADPDAPRLAGELKIPGFSSYLHPVGDGQLLGLGQDADPATGAVRGAQASLFDVSDPAAPALLDTVPLGSGDAFVASDSRAFAWDASRGLALVPFSAWSRSGADVVGLSVGEDGVVLAGRAQLPDAQVLRAFVDGDRVLAVGTGSVVVLDVDGLRVRGVTPLA